MQYSTASKSLAFALVLLLTGCVTVGGTVTSFHRLDGGAFKGKTIAISAVPESRNESLEWASHKKKIELNFQKVGFVASEDPAVADYIAFVSYGIDEGRTEVETVPIFGKTGGGTRQTTGNVGGANFSSTTYSMPSYGLVATGNRSSRVYSRVIQIDIIAASNGQSGKPQKVYEGKITSEGSCSTVTSVLDPLLQMIFSEDWPSVNGQTVSKSIQLPEVRC